MPQMCPKCSHNNRGKKPGPRCSQCGTELLGLLGFGEVVNGYEPRKVLGCGGFSAVYMAKDLKNDREVALKELFELDEKEVKRFDHEAEVLGRLSHPQLPRYYDHFENKGQRYLVMEFIRGQSLHDIVLEKKKQGEMVREVVAFGWALQLCDALAYLHGEGIIHRDIKPDNVRLTPTGEICLVDLGIAKRIMPGTANVTMVHGLTPGYAPIEQYASRTSRYKGRTDERTDVYALGATLYTVVTNLIPPDARALVAGTEILAPVQAVHPQISDRFAITLERATELQPQARFASITEMKSSFEGKVIEPPPPITEGKGSPFLFSDGREARNLAEFISLCDESWAKEHLYQGHIEQWDWLPANGKFGLVTKAREIRENQPNQDIGLDEWLEMAAQVAKIERKRPQVVLSVEPTPPIDWGEVRDWDAESRSIQLRLKLEGSRTRRSVVGCAPCLEVSSTEIDWPSSGVTTLDVALRPGAALELGEQPLPEAVWLETDHQKQVIEGRIVVRAPIEIEVEPTKLDFGRVDPKRPETRALTIRNPGKEGWKGSLETESWLEASPRRIACDAGGEIEVEIRLGKEALERPGKYRDESAVRIRVEDQIREVQAQASLRVFRVSPHELDFETIDAAHQPLRQFQLHVAGEAEWHGESVAKVPWLEIRKVAELSDGDTGVEITVAVQPDGLEGPGVYEEEQAIVISEKEETVSTVAARLVASEPSLEFSTQVVDFGRVTDCKSASPQQIRIHNPSLFEWRGTVQVNAPWLEIKPASLSCAGGKDVVLEIDLSSKIDEMSPESLQQTDAILVEGMGQEYSLGAKLAFLPPPKPEPETETEDLQVDPPSVDFGQVPAWTMAKPQRIELRNAGNEDLRLRIESTLPWVGIEPRIVDCPAGGRVEVTVSLSQMARHLRPGPYARPGAISIVGGPNPQHLEVRLEIKPVTKTGIEVEPAVLDFGQVAGPAQSEREIKITNYDETAWAGRVSSIYPWLEYSPTVVQCLAGQMTIVSVRLSRRYFKSLLAKDYDRAEAIVIRGQTDDKVFCIGVRLTKVSS